jgi:3-dehydroquinate synthase
MNPIMPTNERQANTQLDALQTAWASTCSAKFQHRVWWSDHVLTPGNAAFAAALADVHGHCVAFVDSGVAQSWPNLQHQLADAFAALQITPLKSARTSSHAETNSRLQHSSVAETAETFPPSLAHFEMIPGGEACKDGLKFAERVAKICFDHGVNRHGAVIAIGGGAVLDAVGFGAAIAHRGVRMIRIPTTTLAQDDSAMGVKCGVNMYGQKNALGCFTSPWAILCDEQFLSTLPIEHWLGGFSEAVKIALLKDAPLFEQLETRAKSIVSRDMQSAAPILRRSAWLHREHILNGGDPFEVGSARPLDHGHWSAHRLEVLSQFAVPHGQAVSIGIALDACLAVEMRLLDKSVAKRILRLLQSLQLPIWHPILQADSELFAGLEQFRQHLGGNFAIPLLNAIGSSRDVTRISAEDLRNSIITLRTLAS